jgi:hypothetical protein
MKAEVSPFDAIRYGTRLCAHAANSTMHRTNAANTATSNTASIMLAPIESRLPLEVLICRGQGTFPAIFHDRDCEALGFNASKSSMSYCNSAPNLLPILSGALIRLRNRSRKEFMWSNQ